VTRASANRAARGARAEKKQAAPLVADRTPHENLAKRALNALNERDLLEAGILANLNAAKHPDDAYAHALVAVVAHNAGDLVLAAAAGERAIERDAANPEYHANLGAAYRGLGRPAQAEAAYAAALRIDPTLATAHYNRANLLKELGRTDEAIDAYRQAVWLRPSYAEAWHALGSVYRARGEFHAGLDCFRKALEQQPDHHDILNAVAICLMALDRHDEAQTHLLHAIRVKPDFGTAHGNLGALYLRNGRLAHAHASTLRAHELEPEQHRWISNLAVLAKDRGQWDEAERWLRKALAMRPDYASGHSNLLFCLNYHPERTAEDIYAEYRRWDAAHALPHFPASPAFANDRDPARRLRVGYMSPDFRDHAARFFIEPLLANHDRRQVELFCYAEVPNPDATTRRFQAMADHWRPTVGLSDDQVAAMIRADGIDIMVDCGGHTSQSRLLALARKPAPVQIAYMIGHGATSGMRAMDWFLTDPVMAPPNAEAVFAEGLARLPRIAIAYAPPAAMPDVGALPARARGYVTFGYFGRPERLNDRVVATWSAILAAVPGSRLVLNSKSFLDPGQRASFEARFGASGITPDRLSMVYTTPQPKTWAAYGEIDIALDPFPHNAGTTTIEALWMGVPVVTLTDRVPVGRFGASILGSVGLPDWVAADVDQYVIQAVRAASDLDALESLRQRLRPMFVDSPLHDGESLARYVERAMREMWKRWCGKEASPPASRDTAITAYHSQRDDAALAQCDALLARDPQDHETRHLRALILHRMGEHARAAADMRVAIAAVPKNIDWLCNAIAILRHAGALDEAEAAGINAIAIDPSRASVHNNLGNVRKDMGRLADAVETFRQAIAVDPAYADAWCNLAWALGALGRASEAEDAARAAIARNPADANAFNNLGSALLQQERLAEAGAAFEEAVRIRPGFAIAHSNVLFCANYRTDLEADAIADLYRGWNRQHAAPLAAQVRPHDNERSPERRLRIGYVSPDFRHHAVSFFIEPLIAAHDRCQVEVFGYSDVKAPDQVTQRFESLCEGWVNAVGMNDATLAERIRTDRIDILIDLAGHTGGNRLLTFARKPAPVQIAHMIGAGVTTGLDTFDGFLSDDAFAPPGSDSAFSEPLIRLPRIPLVYAAPAGMPAVGPLPALQGRGFTFGCFSRMARINDEVIAIWAQILQAVPGARLVLNSKPLQEAVIRQSTAARFAQHGIDASRIDMVYTTPQTSTWAAYGDIDVALDPFPHNAGTTTFEALWMGVPVVSLKARPPVGRFGAAILGAMDLDAWVAATPQAYVDIAVKAASDLDALALLRQELRNRMNASPLRDAPGLARVIEQVCRTAWRAWCGRA